MREVLLIVQFLPLSPIPRGNEFCIVRHPFLFHFFFFQFLPQILLKTTDIRFLHNFAHYSAWFSEVFGTLHCKSQVGVYVSTMVIRGLITIRNVPTWSSWVASRGSSFS